MEGCERGEGNEEGRGDADREGDNELGRGGEGEKMVAGREMKARL